MRHGPLGAALMLLSATPCIAQDVAGISTPVLPSCIAGVTLDARRMDTDTAYGAIGLDGVPWLKIGDIEGKKAGSQKPTLRVIGTGMWWLLDGTMVPFHFLCVIDRSGRPTKMQANPQIPAEGDTMPPHRLVAGIVAFARQTPAPGGGELRVQLLDLSAPPGTAVVAEQVVRTGQTGPIRFALRLSADTPLADRRLAINAIVVQQGGGLLRLKQPSPLTEADFKKPIALTVE